MPNIIHKKSKSTEHSAQDGETILYLKNAHSVSSVRTVKWNDDFSNL